MKKRTLVCMFMLMFQSLLPGVVVAEILPENEFVHTYTFKDVLHPDAQIPQQILKDGESFLLPATPLLAPDVCQVFQGWYLGEQKMGSGPVEVASSESFEVEAKYKDVCLVQFEYDGKLLDTKEVKAGTPVTDTSVIYNEDGVLYRITNNTKGFSHWTEAENGVCPANGSEFNLNQAINKPIKLCLMTKDVLKVTRESKGGAALDPAYVNANSQIQEPQTPERKGYTFLGWSKTENGEKADFPQMITENQTFYALWEAKTDTKYKVVYWHENAEDEKYSYVETVEKTGETDTPAIYEEKVYTGFTFESADQVEIKGDGSTLVNVYYKRNQYILTFCKKYSKRFSNQCRDDSIILTGLVKHGATTKPYLVLAEDEVHIQSSQSWGFSTGENKWNSLFAPFLMPMSNGTYLLFSEDVVDNGNYTYYTLNFSISGENGLIIPALKRPRQTRTKDEIRNKVFNGGRVFEGFTWKSLVGLRNIDDTETTETPVEDDPLYPYLNPETDQYEMYSYYTRNHYDVDFVDGDEKVVSRDVPFEADLTAELFPEEYKINETKKQLNGVDYVFAGWYDNQDLVGGPYVFDGKKMPAKNLVLYAKWEPKPHTVIYHLDLEKGASDDDPSEKVSHEQLVTQLPDPKAGRNFLGYFFKNGESLKLFDPKKGIYKDMEVYDVYDDAPVKLIYKNNQKAEEVCQDLPQDSNNYMVFARAEVQSAPLNCAENRHFIGWQQEGDPTSHIYYPGDRIQLLKPETVLVPVFEEVVPTIQVSYESNGETKTITGLLRNGEYVLLTPEDEKLAFKAGANQCGFVFWSRMIPGKEPQKYQPGATVRLDEVDQAVRNHFVAEWEPCKIPDDGGDNPDQPVDEPNKPGEDPNKPGEDPNKPGEDPNKPGDEPNKPGDEPNKPGDEPNKPGDEPNKPGDEPNKPGDEPNKPVDEPNKPVDEPNKPGDEPNKPGDEPNKPGDEPNKPGDEPNKPGDEPNKPGDEPNKPGDEPRTPISTGRGRHVPTPKNPEPKPGPNVPDMTDPIKYRIPELPKILVEQNTKIKTYVKVLPKTGVLSAGDLQKKVGIRRDAKVETHLPSAETFKLAGSTDSNLAHWLQVLPKKDQKADQYIVLPKQGLVMPVHTVAEHSKAYNNFINGRTENFLPQLHNGAVQLPGTSLGTYGQAGNKVIAGHSSYWKNSSARYKTHFQKIIGMETGEQIWIYQKTANGSYERFVYSVNASYNTADTDISVIKPTANDQLTLMTCTPIGGVAGRWIVKATFIGH